MRASSLCHSLLFLSSYGEVKNKRANPRKQIGSSNMSSGDITW